MLAASAPKGLIVGHVLNGIARNVDVEGRHFQPCAPLGLNLLLPQHDCTLEGLLLKILNLITTHWPKAIYFQSSIPGSVWKKHWSGNIFLHTAHIKQVALGRWFCSGLWAKLCRSPGRDWENATKLTARVCWNCFNHQTRISVLLRFARGKFTVPLFSAASERYCRGKGHKKNTFCAPKSLSRLRFSIPRGACCCRVVGALVGLSQVWALSLPGGDSFEKGYAATPTVSANLKPKTAASRDDKVWRVPPRIIQSSSEQHSQTSITLTHPKRVLIPKMQVTEWWLVLVQSGSRGERARKIWIQAGIFWKTPQHFAKGCKAKGICERHPSLSWSAILILGSECVSAFCMALQKRCRNTGK